MSAWEESVRDQNAACVKGPESARPRRICYQSECREAFERTAQGILAAATTARTGVGTFVAARMSGLLVALLRTEGRGGEVSSTEAVERA